MTRKIKKQLRKTFLYTIIVAWLVFFVFIATMLPIEALVDFRFLFVSLSLNILAVIITYNKIHI
jgi:hypothetical protein